MKLANDPNQNIKFIFPVSLKTESDIDIICFVYYATFYRLPICFILVVCYAEITLKIQSADRIFVFLSADKHQFVGRLMLLH